MYKEVVTLLAIIITSASCLDQGRIVGGNEVDIASYPFMASIQRMDGKHFCGATILNHIWLLTAAHCGCDTNDEGNLIKANPMFMWIQIGSINKTISAVGAQRFRVKSFYLNENFTYAHDTMHFDIALVRVERPMKFGDGVQPVNLPKKRNPAEDPKAVGKCIALGWGRTKPVPKEVEGQPPPAQVNPSSDILKIVELPLVSMKFCKEKNTLKDQIVSHANLCTYSNNTEDTCQGDSGGPLMCNGEQWGITSWGDGCAQPDSPSIWTRVDNYLDWIAKATASNASKRTDTSSLSHSKATSLRHTPLQYLLLLGYNYF